MDVGRWVKTSEEARPDLLANCRVAVRPQVYRRESRVLYDQTSLVLIGPEY